MVQFPIKMQQGLAVSPHTYERYINNTIMQHQTSIIFSNIIYALYICYITYVRQRYMYRKVYIYTQGA